IGPGVGGVCVGEANIDIGWLGKWRGPKNMVENGIREVRRHSWHRTLPYDGSSTPSRRSVSLTWRLATILFFSPVNRRFDRMPKIRSSSSLYAPTPAAEAELGRP